MFNLTDNKLYYDNGTEWIKVSAVNVIGPEYAEGASRGQADHFGKYSVTSDQATITITKPKNKLIAISTHFWEFPGDIVSVKHELIINDVVRASKDSGGNTVLVYTADNVPPGSYTGKAYTEIECEYSYYSGDPYGIYAAIILIAIEF